MEKKCLLLCAGHELSVAAFRQTNAYFFHTKLRIAQFIPREHFSKTNRQHFCVLIL